MTTTTDHITKQWTEQTGGGITVTFIQTESKLIAISEDAIGIYKSMEDFENGNMIAYVENYE